MLRFSSNGKHWFMLRFSTIENTSSSKDSLAMEKTGSSKDSLAMDNTGSDKTMQCPISKCETCEERKPVSWKCFDCQKDMQSM
jgi:hypothetical protein